MITIYFVRNGSKIRVEVPIGRTVMEAAKYFSPVSIPEIPGDCGGSCACATCHIYVDEKWIDKLSKINDNMAELELLEYEKGYKKDISRLGCQIYLTKELDGLILHLNYDDIKTTEQIYSS